MCCDIIINYNRHTNINLCSSVCEGGEEFIDEIAMENKNIHESNYLDDKSIGISGIFIISYTHLTIK